MKDGSVANIRLVAASGDVLLGRAVFEGITKSNPFPPLPSGFTGSYLTLRLHFYYTDNGKLD